MLEEHIGYLSDGRRTELFRAAVTAAVKPGDVVADLGCGTGILGLMCLQAGAARVHAIDSGPIVHVARETFRREGFADRATVIRGITHRIELPEKADLLVCDHVGYFGFDYGLLRLLDDARRRFLKPGGRIVPARLDLGLVPVESPEDWTKASRWQRPPVPPAYGWVAQSSLNTKHSVSLGRPALLAEPLICLSLSLLEPAPEVLKLEARFRVTRTGTLHGLAGFFDCELFAGHRMTNRPGAEGATERPQAFLPLVTPASVSGGEEIVVTVTARPADDLIAWDVRLPAQGLKIRQSTLEGLLIGPEDRRRLDPSHRPRPSADAEARMIVLDLCDGTRSADEIAAEVLRRHPTLMPEEAEIRRFVARVIETDTR